MQIFANIFNPIQFGNKSYMDDIMFQDKKSNPKMFGLEEN